MNELHSYLWNYDEFNRKNGIETNTYLSLVDSSIAGQSGIRSQIVPTLVKFMSENKNSFDNINIFEIGRCVTGLDENNLAIEENHLGICIASQNQTSEQLFFRLKEILLDITRNIYNVAVSIGTEKSNIPFVHPVNSTKILSTDKEIGYFGLIHPSVKMSIDKRFNIAVLEVDLNKLATSEEIKNKVKKVSKFQDVNIDYTFLVPKGMKYSEMEMHINEFKAKMVWSCKLTDIFNSKELGDYSAYTFKFNICSLEKTLTANDIDTFNYRILEHMKKIGLNLKN